ncbi:MAG TPA: hypothetical protein VLB44_18675 [Kofleriaceae bacterium]|nr:hypothetical protein [Kofleriaceae bacterium]
MRAVVCLAFLAACGRFGFGDQDAISDGSTIGGDGPGVGGDGDAASVVCPIGLDLCDGFEAGIDTTTWTVDTNVTLDTTFAHRGSASIHVHMPAFGANSGSYQTMSETKTITNGATTFWIRGWFWLGALPALGNGMELITAERPGSAGDYVFVFADSTHVYSQFGGASVTTATTMPVGSWFCAIFKVARSTSSSGSLELSGDAPSLVLANTKTDAAQAMTTINIGIGFASSNNPVAQPAFDLWIDDVIVHSSAVTCAE